MKDERVMMVNEGWTGPGRRDGRIEPLNLAEDGLHMDLSQRGVYEWWYFDAHLDSGHTIVVFFHASNPNPGLQGKIGVEFVFIESDGRRTQRFFPYDRTEFSAASDWPEVEIGQNTIKVDQGDGQLPIYHIFVDETDLGCDLYYAAEVNGWKPGTGYSYFGDMGYFAWVVPFARASVSGNIRTGQETFQVSGIGYHDHNWLNFEFQRIIDYWMWGRVYSDNYTLAYAYIQCNDSVDYHTVKVLMLARGSEVLLSTGEFVFDSANFEYDERAKYHYPRKVRISAQDEFEASLQVKRVLEAQDLLDNYNPFLRFIARHVLRLKPGYFRLVSEFEVTVTQAGQTETETGITLHEIVMFRPVQQQSTGR